MDIKIKDIIEAALFAANEPLSILEIQNLFLIEERPDKYRVKELLNELEKEYEEKSIELVKTASGYRFQVKTEFSQWVSRLWEEKPVKYSRALLETLAIIAYQQPATRGEIEGIRGVAVSTNIIRTLEEREWIRVVGHKEVPGKPALYATTRQFLDYFNLLTLADLPTLAELQELDHLGENALPLNFVEDIENNQQSTQYNEEKITS
jgi:segregation and condensation protein B